MEIDYWPLEIDMISANDLANMNFLTKMDVYIVSSISSDGRSIERTPIDKNGGKNPKWKRFKMNFYIDESEARLNQVTLMFQIMSRRVLGDRTIGFVQVPVKALLDEKTDTRTRGRAVSYQVTTLSGKTQGTLCFVYKFGDKFKVFNRSDQGYNYGSCCQNCTCNYGHLPIMYDVSYVGPKHQHLHAFPSQQQQGYISVGQHKKSISSFGLCIIFDWATKILEGLFCPLWLMRRRTKVDPH